MMAGQGACSSSMIYHSGCAKPFHERAEKVPPAGHPLFALQHELYFTRGDLLASADFNKCIAQFYAFSSPTVLSVTSGKCMRL